MQPKDPFGLDGEGGAVRPLRRPSSRAGDSLAGLFAGGTEEDRQQAVPESLSFGRVSVNLRWGNALLVAGAEVLGLAQRLREDPDAFTSLSQVRETAERSMQAVRTRLETGETSPQDVADTLLVLGALLDDFALNGPWPGKAQWRQEPLGGSGRDARGPGQQVIDLMEECLAAPRERYYLLELIYVVMALGFEGPFRLDARGPLLLIQYRERLLATIRQEADHHPRASVSPAGQSSAHKALAFLNPFTMALGGVLFIAISLGIAVLLFGETEEGLTAEEGNAAVLAVLASPELQPVEDPVPARTRQILRDDLASRTVSLEETPSSMMVTLTEDDLFPPGAADLRPDADGMLRRVGAAIGVASGPVCVIIVRNRAAEGLSEQRAEAVVGYLAPWAQEKGEKIMRTVIDPPASAGTPSFPAGEVQIVLGKSVRPWSPAAGALPAVAWY